MEQLTNTFQNLNIPIKKGLSEEAFLQIQIGWMNAEQGKLHLLDGIECKKCLNRGIIYLMDEDGYVGTRDCVCMKKRMTKRRMMESGLGRLLEKCTFASYRTDEPWQTAAKSIAIKYAEHPKNWMLASGQSGSGKTHICTAVCNVLLESGHGVVYKIWSDLFHALDAAKYHYEERQQILDDLGKAEFLYIDDFLKGYDGDKNMVYVALDVINKRYNAEKPLILSTEYTITELEKMDIALAGRIDEMSKGQKIQILKEKGRNLRKGVQT